MNGLMQQSHLLQHCAGVNAVLVDHSHGCHTSLWTASRDSTVKQWDISSSPRMKNQTCIASFEGHTDWVNDIQRISPNAIASCSNDRSVRTWALDTQTCTSCLSGGHSQYITCLASPGISSNKKNVPNQAENDGNSTSTMPFLISAGLGGELCLWDAEASSQIGRTLVTSSSIYSMTLLDDTRPVIVAGLADGKMLIFDLRCFSARKTHGENAMRVGELRGHSNTVRALLTVSSSSPLVVVSGSSDGLLKTWDISNMKQCIETYAVHEPSDSVWSLAANPVQDPGVVYSGGRSGCVYRTHLKKRQSERVCGVLQGSSQCDASCIAVVYKDEQVDVWVGSSSTASMVCWGFGLRNHSKSFLAPRSHRVHYNATTRTYGERTILKVGTSSQATEYTERQQVDGIQSLVAQPSAMIPGIPPIKKAVVLSDKRRVLTQDSEGQVELWDLTTCSSKVLKNCRIAQTGKHVTGEDTRSEFEEYQRTFFDPTHALDPWFSLDTKRGVLALTLTPPLCFAAEVYAQDLGHKDASCDVKLNYGERMVHAVFQDWKKVHVRSGDLSTSETFSADADAPPLEEEEKEEASCAPPVEDDDDDKEEDCLPCDAQDGKRARHVPHCDRDEACQQAFVFGAWAGAFKLILSPRKPSLRSDQHADPCMLRCDTMHSLKDVASVDLDPSSWIFQCLVNPEELGGSKKTLSMAFHVLPAPHSSLPILVQNRLNAPKILRIEKVAEFIVNKLEAMGIQAEQCPLYWCAQKQEAWERARHAQNTIQSTTLKEKKAAAAADNGMVDTLHDNSSKSIHFLRAFYGSGAEQHPQTRPAIHLTCNGVVLPWDFSLAAVKKYIWKRPDGEDVTIEYSIRDLTAPLTLPNIRLP